MSDLALVPFADLIELNPRPRPKGNLVRYVGMEDVSEDGRLLRAAECDTRTIATGQPSFEEHDVLFAKITPCMENGKGAYVTGLSGAVAYGSTEFHVLRARPGTYPRFVYHWTMAREFRRRAELMMTGSAGQRRVPALFFSRFQVPLFSYAEQRRIVELLDALDATIQARENAAAKCRNVRQGLLLQTLAPIGCSSPEGWQRVPLKEVVPSVDYGISTALTADPSGLPVLRMNNLRDGRAELSELRYSSVPVPRKLYLRSGDVLFNRTNSIEHVGRAGIWIDDLPAASFASYLVRLKPDSSRLLPEYLVEWLQHPVIRQRVRSIATVAVQQVNVNPSRLRELEIDVPVDLGDQRRVCNMLAACDERITREEAEVAKLRQVKLGLVDDLLTGRVRIDELD
jgi:type I restriction enzyme S subunit